MKERKIEKERKKKKKMRREEKCHRSKRLVGGDQQPRQSLVGRHSEGRVVKNGSNTKWERKEIRERKRIHSEMRKSEMR